MIIQLLCDHKWRDLPNLVVLKIRLNSLGHKVYISSTKDSEAMISIFKPDCVVINNLFSRRNRRLAQLLKKLNVIIILLPTEGAVRPEFKKIMDGDFANYDLIDLILPWSEISAKGIRKRWRFSKERVKVAGYNRLDFYNKKMINIVEKKDIFCSRHDLNPNKPIVTWATQYGYAFLIHKEKYSQHFEQWLRESKETGQSSCWKEIGINPKDIPKIHAKGRENAGKAFFKLTKIFPNVQFLIKPHPSEDIDYYKNLIIENSSKNVILLQKEYIWDVLNATDIELHRHCTTAIESWVWNKPTIEMAMDSHPKLIWKDRERGSDVVKTDKELIKIISKYIKNSEVSNNIKSFRKNYIKKWFGDADGNRINYTADIINDFLLVRPSKKKLYDFHILGVSSLNLLKSRIRYFLNIKPNEKILKFFKPKTNDNIAHDKLITRSDVINYEKKLISLKSKILTKS